MAASLCFLCSAFPPSFLPHLLLLCVCLWVWQQLQQLNGTPDIIDCLFLPGLSTTSALDYCILYGELMVLLLNVFCVLSFVLMPFLFITFQRGLQSHSTLLCLCSPESLHTIRTAIRSMRPSFPACLPTYLESPSSRPHHLPAPVCTINLPFTTFCLRCLHLGPKIQSQL